MFRAMNVLFITNIPSPYRVEFFNELGKWCKLTVWFEAEIESNREWAVDKSGMSFAYEFLKGFTLGLDKHVNLSVLSRLRATKFDVYIMGGYSTPTEMIAVQWLKLNKLPFFLNSDGGFPAKEHWLKYKLKQYFISSATDWLSSGANCTDYLAYYGASRNRIYEYPFASLEYTLDELMPISEQDKEQFKAKEGLRHHVVLSVGQFIDRKGYMELLQRAHELDDGNTSLVVIGGGPLRSKYERYIRDNHLGHVSLRDFMSKENLILFYKTADVFILPTLYDAWGLVINEALRFGLPIITTSGAGAAYSLVEHGRNGYIIDSSDMESFMQKCKLLRDSPELRYAFGQLSLQKSDEYTIRKMASKHVELIASFMQRNTNRKVVD
jgi:glycosyltransferase involved in cell wall biosynthesis